ncbi:AAA family ATPase [Lusitaniella coriacea]|uniref:AAA family ATPase n=1 Tax=Lusitaniella coriacea TaxID=1983105 RepID=UPI003CEDA193
MKLNTLRLCNFRQFYGKTQEIALAAGTRNTTMIHGNNGAGKTTLLNAFTWVLYERFTAAFSSPEFLINKRAITEANVGTSIECWAEITFEHENKNYQLKRHCYACRDRDGIVQYSQSKFFMLIAGDDGRWYPPTQQPTDVVQGILPESLHQYFFFDGERIDRIFRSDGRKNTIAEDTKELLGVKVLDRAIDHLKKVMRVLQDELAEIGDAQTQTLLGEQGKLEQARDRAVQRQQEMTQELETQEQLKQIASQRLIELGGSEELQKLKEQLEIQERTIQQNLAEAKQQIKQLISSRGFTVLLPNVVGKFQVIINELRQKGELPAGIKQQFIQELLARQQCICGTELKEGMLARQNVQKLLKNAGIANIEEAVIRLEAQTAEIEQQIPLFWQETDRKQANIHQWRSELSDLENQLDEVKRKLRTYPDENIQNLQKNLDVTETAIRGLILEQGGNQQQIEQLNREIEEKVKRIAKHQLKEEKQVLTQRRIQVTKEAIERLIEVRSRLERQFRFSLEKRVQEIFSTISFTPYSPRLSTDYELTLLENTSGIAVPVAASTGENQILSLSFIGGIIDRVREWSQKNALMGPDSSTFPIVMDSPFGSLDEIYRRRVAQVIPQLANQLIILATKTQWRGEVAAETADHIGKEYVLTYYSPKPDCEEDFIELGGVNYPLVQRSPNQFEYTEIIPVPCRSE